MSAQISNQYVPSDSAERVQTYMDALTSTATKRSRERADQLVEVVEELFASEYQRCLPRCAGGLGWHIDRYG